VFRNESPRGSAYDINLVMQKLVEDILSKLGRFGVSTTDHGQTTLRAHLKGTHDVLNTWACPRYVCLAGLCHSIYGTESFSKVPATIDNRDYVQGLIGSDAEQLAYLFGAHVKESLWKNLDRAENYSIADRFTNKEIALSEQELSDLITITLGNWLEQRPRANLKHQSLRQEEFLRSERFLPKAGYQDFLSAYGLRRGE